MIIQIVDAPAVPGGKALLLCDDSGKVMGQQLSCDLKQNLDGAELTVTFRVDGEHLRYA